MGPGTGCGEGAPRILCERLKVLAVAADHLVLAADRAAGCAGCAARAGCGAGALAGMAGPTVLSIARPEGFVVRPGDEIELAMAGNAFLAAAGLAYLLPAAALVAAVCGAAAAGLSDLGAGAVGALALALSFVPLARAERRGGAALEVQAVHPAPGGRA
ncbi:SoxR reducing system RseC family protein [Frigidibacter sp.]|uniref:SoxR reducing system RseC family protein n=1 Tax=Frigidibacter sp. TaxID=2586418 RepID=UPI002733B632|nr:SoxR reducing system RseC family protein [Frigidibacter sp.]MDP3340377.1 SoxR reducing system RseC family protein [Frigidibacter sp.]